MHLLIPFAASPAAGAGDALTRLTLPKLTQLLRRLTLVHTDAAQPTSRSLPHERALARSLGLPVTDGMIPWAARQSGSDAVCAWFSLCHWQARVGRITLGDPRTLNITAAESAVLLEAMRPYFAEDGIALSEHSPGLWLAKGEPLRGLACTALDRVIGRRIEDWMPEGPTAALAHRLQNEMQMLLYTHPVNDARTEQGLLPINSFWLHGAGAVPADFRAPNAEAPSMPLSLRDAAVSENWAGWSQAWQALDAGPVTQALALLEQGRPVTLTLCGERAAQRFEWRRRSLLQRIHHHFTPTPMTNLFSQL
jgi:hypothetical protein